MKRIVYITIVYCAAALLFAACNKEGDTPCANTGTDGNSIILDIASGSLPVSRAEAAGAEIAVGHIDVLIFAENGTKAWHERVNGSGDGMGQISLSAKKDAFGKNKEYWVYLIANSTHASKDFTDLADRNALRAMMQEDRNIHMTGNTEASGAPQTFLMDGVAYPKGNTEPGTAAPVVLYNGSKTDDTELRVTLRRAAAKIVVRINKGDDVTFDSSPAAHEAGYYLLNMPYTTSVIAGVGGEAELRNSGKTAGSYFHWTETEITVTAYAYAHKWQNESSLEQEVRLVVNIPLTYGKDDDPELRPNNYYQIPVSRTKVLERNTCYEVMVTVNAPGADDPSEPVPLKDINYSVQPWSDRTIDVGGTNDLPLYLTLNKDEMQMHNMEDDHTTLQFTSSSEVEAEITRVYYIDKFGQEQKLENISGDEWGVSSGNDWTNRCTLRITPDEGINGKIDVFGDVPKNNTVRYIEFTVTNKTGQTRSVTVAQYPLEYITNIQGWYSYRDDFKESDSKPTTYQYRGDGVVGVSLNNNSTTNWNGRYTLHKPTSSWDLDGFWRSKVADEPGSDGKSTINYYYYSGNSVQDTRAERNGNARMYHVVISATSDDYTLGRPRLTEDEHNQGLMVTDPGEDNALLVSPSFMIASRLGFVNTGDGGLSLGDNDNSLRIVREHCARYVEVYRKEDGTVVTLDDWRLPTEAELKIIMKFQGTEDQDADAIDYLLNAGYYYSASGRVANDKSNSDGTSVRCIRDAYDDKK